MSLPLDESPLTGYVLHILRTDNSALPLLRVFLRPELSEVLILERDQREQAHRDEQERLAQEQARVRENCRGETKDRPNQEDPLLGRVVGARTVTPARLSRRDEFTPLDEAILIETFENHDPNLDAKFPVHQVLRGRDVLDAVSRARRVRDADNSQRELDLLARVLEKGAFRAVRSPGQDAAHWANACARLDAHHPQFRAVTRFVEACVNLAGESLAPLRVPPILLVGPPGIGKTHFAMDLAEAMTLPVRLQSMESVQSPSLFLGTERHWSTSGTGVIFELVVLGDVANPVLVIDEIDKAKNSQHEPINAFHALLEPRTATAVRDAGLDLQFDASLVVYIATANDEQALPLSIRSRFKIFPILPPRGAAALDLAHVVATDAVQKLGVPNFALPSRALTKALAHVTAREIKNAVQQAVGVARAAGRLHLELWDFPADLLEEEGASHARRLH